MGTKHKREETTKRVRKSRKGREEGKTKEKKGRRGKI